MKLVYPAFSKHLFYFRMHISAFVLKKGYAPINPFMNFEYFMLDTVERDVVRDANNSILRKADEVWVFGRISDGVLAEIRIAKKTGKPVRYYSVGKEIREISKDSAEFEDGLEKFAGEL
ncbi:MAG TPA: DUF4406 domain-containing protein [Candidatus Nanoarchaeia archaeon]|nr:DUF4406 domain-containing protein [Candidatus Nanoarchaeia archaeon]